ncbi:unnamed protein product [Porites evermanni]|uniref:Uncharacterized protein n=1 Tax=Porites evermanni TaxID=104178 RepID=A0ABN8M6W7_9CNID|nr:unnamed protein product [Porites evermanni]
MCSQNERVQSSTWKELSVIELSLQSFVSMLEGLHVRWFTDSQVAAKIVEVGSMKLKDANLKNLRIAALGSLAFAGCFRYDELCNIVPKHIEFHSDYIRIFVPRSKTDVTFFIPKTPLRFACILDGNVFDHVRTTQSF